LKNIVATPYMNNITESLFRNRLTEVKQDLNHIYTEKPFDLPSGLDFGWFCIEHALHLCLLARLFHFHCELIKGDIGIKHKLKLLSTFGTDAYHFWCKIEESQPVDISVSFKYLNEFPDLELIYGLNSNSSPYIIENVSDERKDIINSLLESHESIIIFLPQESQNIDSYEIINNPNSLLNPAPDGCKTYTEIHGNDIYNMITMHCYKLVTNQAKPLSKYCNYEETLKKIKQWNPNAREEILQILNC